MGLRANLAHERSDNVIHQIHEFKDCYSFFDKVQKEKSI